MSITASRLILHEEPDENAPERLDHETWYEYACRWQDYWDAQYLERSRYGNKWTPLGGYVK